MNRGAFLTAVVQGLNVSYKVFGNGDCLAFIFHGWGAPVDLYDETAEILSERYTVIVPEFPGFGLSDEPGSPWGMTEYAAFAVEFISSFGPDRGVCLLGHSFGGRVIIKLAASNDLPFEIDRIVLIDSAGIKPKKSAAVKMKIALYKAGKKVILSRPFKKIFPEAAENFQNRSGSSDYRNASPMMRQCFVRIVNEDLSELLPAIKAPVLLVWGENDKDTPLSDGRIMEEHIPDAGLVVLKGAGHYSFLENRNVYRAVLKSYFQLES